MVFRGEVSGSYDLHNLEGSGRRVKDLGLRV